MLVMGRLQHLQEAGDPGRPAAEHRDVERQRLAAVVEEHVRRRARRRGFPAVVNLDPLRRGVVIGEEGAAADARALRLDQRQRRLDGDRRVDRAAAAPKHAHSRLDRERIGGDDENLPARGRRRNRRRRGRARGEKQGRPPEGEAREIFDHPLRLPGPRRR